MSFIQNQAPVLYSAQTSVTGTGSANLWQVSATGVTAGLAAGNFNLVAGPSNNLNGRRFNITYGGWVKAHGASQTIAPGLQIFPYNTTVAGGPTASGTATFTTVASGQLIAGTFLQMKRANAFFGGEAGIEIESSAPPSMYDQHLRSFRFAKRNRTSTALH